MSQIDYRFRLYTPGSTDLSTANVAYTFGSNRLKEAPTVMGPVVVPHLGRTESQAWDVNITDVNSSFASILADSSGRLTILGRIGLVQTNKDGAGWTNLGAGVVTDAYLNSDVASWRCVLQDERTRETNAVMFNTSNTTQLYPPGPAVPYGPFFPAPKTQLSITARGLVSGTTNMWRATFQAKGTLALSDPVVGAIQDNVIVNPALTTDGNFFHLRVRIGATDYPIVSFGTISSTAAGALTQQGYSVPDIHVLANLRDNVQGAKEIALWIAGSSVSFSVGGRYSSASLHMYTAPPSEATPLHIGGKDGLHPMQFALNAYSGSYSSAGTLLPRYSTAAFSTGSTGLLALPMPSIRFRITSPQTMRQWLEDKIYQPYLAVPVPDASGRIVPRPMTLPNSTSVITTTLTGANLRDPHPTWGAPRNYAITVLAVEHEEENLEPSVTGSGPGLPTASKNAAGDAIRTQIRTIEIAHDRVNLIGRNVQRVQAHGVKTGIPTGTDAPVGFNPNFQSYEFQRYLAYVQRDFFDRFGDGPIQGYLYGLSTVATPLPGSFVKLTLGTYPNPQVPGRGGTRIVQLLSPTYAPDGVTWSYLDAGPNLQQLSSPTLSLSTSTADPKHSVVATVGSVPAGGAYNLQVAHSSGAAHPSSASNLWQPWQTTAYSSGTYRIGRRPSNTKVWARIQATKPNRIRSAWVYSTGKTTQKITGPTSLTASSVTAGTILAKWTVGDGNYPVTIHGDTSTSASISTGNQLTRIDPGSKQFLYVGLSAATKYLLGVRYSDPYGGYSTASKLAVTTSSGAQRTCPNMLGIDILFPPVPQFGKV